MDSDFNIKTLRSLGLIHNSFYIVIIIICLAKYLIEKMILTLTDISNR